MCSTPTKAVEAVGTPRSAAKTPRMLVMSPRPTMTTPRTAMTTPRTATTTTRSQGDRKPGGAPTAVIEIRRGEGQVHAPLAVIT